jgi:hypothetical protein
MRKKIFFSDLFDAEACWLETKMIADFHRHKTEQLWNTIDERFMDSRLLPATWGNPENPLYRLPRPIAGMGPLKLTFEQLWSSLRLDKSAYAPI